MTAALDRVLGRVTMYALVILCLTLIAVVAFGLSLFGQLNVSPTELLVSAVVLFTFSYLANGVFGVIFRTHPQLSSTAITALILLFVFQPPHLDDLAGLGGLALAATAAVASKYLFAWRRRHIFNPAAFGAVVVGITGLAFPSWWVGTPPLLPFVIIGALLVLFRTRRIPLGAAYVGVAAVTMTLVSVVTAGTSFQTALSFALFSSPIWFFAGFMLSEPLTLPPRRWQQMSLAVFVAIFASIPFQLGPVGAPILTNSPQLALLVGNLIAFFFGQRRAIRLDLVGRRRLTPTIWEFSFQPLAPVRFEPGQFVELALPHHHTDARGWRRMFSIASAPKDGEPLRFGIRFPERSSSFKRTLFALEPGSRIMATAVYGDFVLPADTSRKLLLVAAGIGITPFVGQLERIANGDKRDVVVVYELTAIDDLAYGHELVAAGCRVIVIAPEVPENLPIGWTWAGAEPLTAEKILETVPDARERETFLSGLPSMVPPLKRALRRSGIKRVRTDAFIGY